MQHDTPPLGGRGPLIADIVRRARDGHGSVVLGPRGSGRSRILEEVTGALGRSGVRAAHLVVTPEIAAAPHGVFAPLLGRDVVNRIARAEAPGPMTALRSAVAALELQALVVDGAPTLDPSAATLMLDVARGGGAVIVAATSEDEAFGALTALSTHGLAAPVVVPPLSLDDARALVEHLLDGHIDAELAAALAAASGGLPGPLTDFVHHGVDTGAIARTGELWRLRSALPTPLSLRAGVAQRLSALTPEERGWVAAVAVAGSIADDIALRIARRCAVQGAERTGWTRHDTASGSTLMRVATDASAVVDSLDDRARRIVLHRLVDAATAVDRPLDDAERVALLRWRLGLGERPEAQEALALAGIPGIHGEVREQLLRAAIAEGARAHASLADHLKRTRRPGEATAIVDAAFEVADSAAERTELARVRAVATGLVERRSGEALVTLDAHIAEHGPHPDLAAVRAGLLLFEGRPQEALETAEPLLGEPGYAGLIAVAHAVVSLRELGEREAGTALAERFGSVAQRSGQLFQEGPGLAGYLRPDSLLTVALDLDGAEVALLDLCRRADGALGDPPPPCAYSLGRIDLLRGDPVAAARWFRAADAGPGTWRDSCLPRVVAGLTAALALAGDHEAAGSAAHRLQQLETPPLHRGRAGLALAQFAASRGDREGAVASAAEVEHHGKRLGLVLDVFDAAYDGLRFGDEHAAVRLLALGPVPAGAGREAQRAHARAVQHGDPSRIGDAAALLWAAGLTLYAIEAAATAAAAGDAVSATRLVVWAARRPGLRLRGATDRRAGVLTSREREVARLAALGLSDRLIAADLGISVRTAQTHLTRAFAKLGVHRRTELADLLGSTERSASTRRRRA